MLLKGKTIFVSGGSRGIGLAIALRAAKDGANIVVAAKTAEPHPKLPGTIFTAAEEIEKVGGKALPIVCDIREENQVKEAINQAVDKFKGIDILINNASAISLTNTIDTSLKKYDLMQSINTRGTWLVSKYAIPHLKKASNPHILTMSPPLSFDPKWYKEHVGYTISKMGMSMNVLGMSEELKDDGIAVNALWPLTLIYTAALQAIGDKANQKELCRTPEIMADSAYEILTKNSTKFTGKFCIDEILLRESGKTNIDKYSCVPGSKKFMYDFFIDDIYFDRLKKLKGN